MTTEPDDRLRALEMQAASAPPHTAADALERASDLCMELKDTQRAVAYLGRAIDANLYARRFDDAVRVCHKLLHVAPGAVRTHCTLAWLAIGRLDRDELEHAVDAYVDAARRTGAQARAAKHLELMAETTPDATARLFIADAIAALGDAWSAQKLRRGACGREGPISLSAEERARLWNTVTSAALLSSPPH